MKRKHSIEIVLRSPGDGISPEHLGWLGWQAETGNAEKAEIIFKLLVGEANRLWKAHFPNLYRRKRK